MPVPMQPFQPPEESAKETEAMKSRTFLAESKLGDYLIQSFHFKDEETEAQRKYMSHQGHVAG